MYLTKESDHEYRFGDHGPKYLTRGDNVDLGIVVITPGEAHPFDVRDSVYIEWEPGQKFVKKD